MISLLLSGLVRPWYPIGNEMDNKRVILHYIYLQPSIHLSIYLCMLTILLLLPPLIEAMLSNSSVMYPGIMKMSEVNDRRLLDNLNDVGGAHYATIG